MLDQQEFQRSLCISKKKRKRVKKKSERQQQLLLLLQTQSWQMDKTETLQRLTSGRLVAVVSVSEVLGILHHGDAGHADDNRIRPRVQGARGNNPVVDVMKGAGRVFFTTDDSYWTWDETEGWSVNQSSFNTIMHLCSIFSPRNLAKWLFFSG